jgi:hypothetical protein
LVVILPNPVTAGGVVNAGGSCLTPGEHLVGSPGFVAPIPLNSSGRVIDKPGRYTASMTCGTHLISAQFTIVAAPFVSVHPKEVQPGGQVTVRARCPGGVGVQAVSAGFVANIPINTSADGTGSGVGKAVTKPGRYQVGVPCKGESLNTTFTILAPVQPNPPGPPQVVVKPKAAPQTGGGFLAGSQ